MEGILARGSKIIAMTLLYMLHAAECQNGSGVLHAGFGRGLTSS